METNTYYLSEIAEICDSRRIPLSAMERVKRHGKYRYYGAQGVIDYVDDFLFDGEYLLIAEDGENLKSLKQNIAQVVTGKFCLNNHAHIIQTNSKCRLRYLYYLINNMNISGYITGSAQPKLSQANMKKIELELPSVLMQDKILSVLGTIDDKIENNKKINKNLEEQVLAIYNQWFEVNSNCNRQTCRAEEYFNIAIGKTPPRKESEWFSANPDDVTWVSISDMGSCGTYIRRSSEQLTKEAIERHNIKIVPDNTVLLSFKLTIGRIAITVGEMTTNEAIAHFKTNNTEITEYLYCYLKNFNYQTMGSTSSIATAVNSKIIKAMPFVIPTDEELYEFHAIAGPIFAMIKENQLQTGNLSKLRDSLLPKLMSGELDVSDIDL
ncbi:restriction endonuclease subunit S [Finegoldia magna]|uniref:restriction endonuclease subunit S n=1 Tax=Finegoldia magna TaxID=1260 RepID=UPI0012B015F1|nr:restriction endonuclease subunit S [Finegoldia magna]MSB17091.1 restriction endonuclease subunit S [Finegoldia magna]